MCSWITNRRGITYVLLILVQITTNSIPLKRATVTFFFTALSKSERLIFIKGLSSLSGVPILTEEVRRSGLNKSWVIWKPRVSSFLLIYIYVTQVLTIKLLSSFSEFTQRRPQFLPLSGLWVSSASTWYYKNCCSSYLTFDFLWSSHSVSVAYLWVNMVNDFSVFLTIGVFFPRNCC